MRVVDCNQQSAEWLRARMGRITASRMADLMATLKRGGEAACRRDYRAELVAERLTGRSEARYVSKEMQFGLDQEPFARTAYEMKTNSVVDQAGFIFHPQLDCTGASPDGLAGKDGGVELKCPKTTTHLAYFNAGVVPAEYQDQILWNMACAEREWWDFASFDPRLPEELNLFIVRMARDEARIAELEREVLQFDSEIEEVCRQLRVTVNLPPFQAFTRKIESAKAEQSAAMETV